MIWLEGRTSECRKALTYMNAAIRAVEDMVNLEEIQKIHTEMDNHLEMLKVLDTLKRHRRNALGRYIDWDAVETMRDDGCPDAEQENSQTGATPEQPIVWTNTDCDEPRKPQGYYGLMHIICPDCGEEHDFGIRKENPIRDFKCKKCGGRFDMYDMKIHKANLYCEKCGAAYFVKTNATGDIVTVGCKGCGAPIDAFWNEHDNEYSQNKGAI